MDKEVHNYNRNWGASRGREREAERTERQQKDKKEWKGFNQESG